MPLPGGIVPPVKEKPRIVVDEVLTRNPFEAAKPPVAALIETLDKSNWKPPTGSSFCM